MQNQMQSAIKELKKIEKQAYDSWSYIGIYKRYKTIGEAALAEKIITKALKKNSGNIELLAVYVNHMLRQNRLEDLAKASSKIAKLKGTKYASLYSELILRQSMAKTPSEGLYSFYRDEQFYQIYQDAYKGSLNSLWARNCAVFDLTHGLYERAAGNVPAAFANADDAYFWALTLYDAGRFYDCIDAVSQSQQLLSDFQNKAFFKTSQIQQVSLASDAYMAISQIEEAEEARRELVLNVDSLTVRTEDEKLLAQILLNSAVWAGNQNLDDQCADLLFYIVKRWPENVPALIHYADFAYRSNLEREEDNEIKTLRNAGLATLEMERYDNRRKIPLSDAVYRLEEASKRTDDPYLSIARLDLHYKTSKNITQKDKARDLWKLLEDAHKEGEKYKMLLVQYALNYLLNTKEYDEAWKLFYGYVTSTANYEPKRDFWEQFIEKCEQYELPIVEFAFWFAAESKKLDEALRLGEYCVYESGGILEESYVSQNVSTASCMNLADVYVGIGRKIKALELYGKAAGRESKNQLRSEIYYRIACIYASDGDIKNALRSTEYACSLYPDNARASLLKDKLKFTAQ